MHLWNVFAAGTIGFLVTIFVTPRIITIAQALGLYDIPGERKMHKRPIPRLGGVAIFLGITIGTFVGFFLSGAHILWAWKTGLIGLFESDT